MTCFELVPWINLLPVPENFEKLYTLDNIPSLHTILNHSQFLETINFYQQSETIMQTMNG